MLTLRKYIKVFILLVLPVYLFLLVNSMMNMHLHVLSNGMIVRHAHPFNHQEDAKQHHHHSKSETCYYQAFFLDYLDTSEPIQRLVSDVIVTNLFYAVIPICPASEIINLNDLRGPPMS